MSSSIRIPAILSWATALLIGVCVLVAPAASQERMSRRVLDSWGEIESRSHTGILYDRVLPLAHLDRLDGSASAPVTNLATWRQGFDELRRASTTGSAAPDLGALDADARALLREGVIPLAIFDRAFERVRPELLNDGSRGIDDGWIEKDGRSPLLAARAFAAAVLTPRTFRGADVVFLLETRRFFSDDAPAQCSIEIDFADGRGPRPVAFGEHVQVRYTTIGRHILLARMTRADGSTVQSRFTFEVAGLAAPSPNDTLHITATILYQGEYGTGDAYVYLAANHASIQNPVVVAEGFDLDNSMNWDELYALLDQENLIETLRADGFDAVVLNFTDATDYLQKNAFVVAELVQRVQSMIAPSATLALVGASMGGLCSRYALAYLESHGVPHRVRTWVSFDAPQAGADIPLGIQYWVKFFSGQSADAATFLGILNRPAARQMLLYHFTDPAGTTGQPDPLRATFLTDLSTAGDFPSLTRRVAIANGSGDGDNQGFSPLDQLIRYEYSSPLVALTGDVWAVPNQASGTVFRGMLRILFSTTNQTVTVTGTLPWDGAPGGFRPSMAEMDTIAAPYGDIVALHPSHCFIPTVSSLDLATVDPFFDVAASSDPLALTPFDAIYFPSANQGHVLITAENAAWVKNEIEQGVVSAPSRDVTDARGLRLLGSPNPFAGGTRLTYSMPSAGLVDLSMFGVDGREVRRLVHDLRSAGSHTLEWDGRDARGAFVPPGMYFMRLETGGVTRTQRVVKLD